MRLCTRVAWALDIKSKKPCDTRAYVGSYFGTLWKTWCLCVAWRLYLLQCFAESPEGFLGNNPEATCIYKLQRSSSFPNYGWLQRPKNEAVLLRQGVYYA